MNSRRTRAAAAERVELEPEDVRACVHRGCGEVRARVRRGGHLCRRPFVAELWLLASTRVRAGARLGLWQPADAPHAAAELRARHRRAELPDVPKQELFVVAARH